MRERKRLAMLALTLYGAIGAWLGYAVIAGLKDSADLPSGLGHFLQAALLTVYAVGAILLLHAIRRNRAGLAIFVPVMFPTTAIAVLIVVLIVLGARF
jgi:hypothetical protein